MSHWLLLCLLFQPGQGPADHPFSDCIERYQGQPTRKLFSCISKSANYQAAIDNINTYIEDHGPDACAYLYLGIIYERNELGPPLHFFEKANELPPLQGDLTCEVYLHSNFALHLSREDRLAEAQEQLDRAEQAAQQSGSFKNMSRVMITRGNLIMQFGGDPEQAERILSFKERALEELSPKLRLSFVMLMGNIAFRYGEYDRAETLFKQAINLAGTEGINPGLEAGAHFNLLTSYINNREPTEQNREELRQMAEATLAMGEKHQHPDVVPGSLYILGLLHAGEQGNTYLNRGLAMEGVTSVYRSGLLLALAANLAETDPQRAKELLFQASTLLSESDYESADSFYWKQRMLIAWETLPRQQAIRQCISLLDFMEAEENYRMDDLNRSKSFSFKAEAYLWLSGQLFQASRGQIETDLLNTGFKIMERRRGRALLQGLMATDLPASLDQTIAEKMKPINKEVAQLHRELFSPNLAEAKRKEILIQLEKQELARTEVEGLAREFNEVHVPLNAASFASIEDVQAKLSEDEALLSFQMEYERDLYDDSAGGSWVVVITRNRVSVASLPDRLKLDRALQTYLGLFDNERNHTLLPQASASIYTNLMAPGLKRLPPEITKLILIPDGNLHQLPFGALREEPDGPPLATRYSLNRAPSATLWLRWRARQPRKAIGALAFADPILPVSGKTNAKQRAWTTTGIGELGRLPFARKEARALTKHLSAMKAWYLEGEEASEHAFKTLDPASYDLVHFAAHAVVDDAHPNRSAVILSAGGENEDGVLTPQEIATIPMEDKIVVLSTCRSSSGRVIRGEGTMSLTRAFLRAGSHSVIGTLWPLRDDQAALFFDRFYKHLARGQSLADAMRLARINLINQGQPPDAWAGLVLTGDGSFVPFPKKTNQHGPYLIAGLIAVLALALWVLGRRR